MSCGLSAAAAKEKKRSAKTTRQQYQMLLEEMESNTAFRTNKYNPEEPDVLEKTWDNLTIKMNSVGGPCKSAAQWKKIFADWKCSVRKKARLLKTKQTGGGPPPDKPLTDLENKLLDLTGKVVIEGIPNVPEVGLSHTDHADENIMMYENENETEDKDNETEKDAPLDLPLKKRKTEPSAQTPKRPPQLTLTQSIKQLIDHNSAANSSDTTHNILREINGHLKQLVELKSKEVMIQEIKLKLKYADVDFEL